MWTSGYGMHGAAMNGTWHWVFGFHGLLWLFLLGVIVALAIALVRDRGRDT